LFFTGLKLGILTESSFFPTGAVLTTTLGFLALAAEKAIRSLKTWLSVKAIAREVKTEGGKENLRQVLTELPNELSQKLTIRLARRGIVV